MLTSITGLTVVLVPLLGLAGVEQAALGQHASIEPVCAGFLSGYHFGAVAGRRAARPSPAQWLRLASGSRLVA
ncbi:MAG: hypothetical protein HC893_08450 [Chloroflexaceae bacterium]|nr:hypothetical protein [Chloroflexaceae bacterium]